MNRLHPAVKEILNTSVTLSILLAAFKFISCYLGSEENFNPGTRRFDFGACCTTFKVLFYPPDSLVISEAWFPIH